MSKHKHRAKHHHWVNGALKTVEHFFDTLEEAVTHSKQSNAQVVKVFSPEGELVHSGVNPKIAEVVSVNSYA